MKKSFHISRAEATVADPEVLMAEILRETGTESEARSILRSLERMGSDASIIGYEVTRETRTARARGMPASAWRVTANRSRGPAAPDMADGQKLPGA